VIVIDNCLVLFPAALVAFTVKADVPAVVGVPEIAPLPKRFKPVGNVPLSRLHVIGVSPVAASVWLYAAPTVPPGNVAVVIVGATPPPTVAIVMDNSFVSFPVELVAFTVKLDAFAVVGVPEIIPLPKRFKPIGNAPLSRLHVMGMSPVAASVWLYAVPTVPPGNVAVVIVGASPPPTVAIVMDNSFVSLPVELAALTVKLDVFAVVGVPETTPLPKRFKPIGNVPLSRLHVTGLSPVAASVWLYAVPTVPPGNVVVEITGADPPPSQAVKTRTQQNIITMAAKPHFKIFFIQDSLM
jgi:hypothetical protein